MESELKAAEKSLSFWEKCAKFLKEVFTWDFFVDIVRGAITIVVFAVVAKWYGGKTATGGST